MLSALLIAGVLFGGVQIGGCGSSEFQPASTPPTPLIPPLASFQSLEGVRAQLAPRELVEEKRSATDENTRRGCPARRWGTYRVEDFEYLGARGPLVLHFSDDRLTTVWFFPADAASFRAQLEAAGLEFDGRDRAALEPTTSVWIFDHFSAGTYVGWADRELEQEARRFVERCS